jgi:hypothetical protein
LQLQHVRIYHGCHVTFSHNQALLPHIYRIDWPIRRNFEQAAEHPIYIIDLIDIPGTLL